MTDQPSMDATANALNAVHAALSAGSTPDVVPFDERLSDVIREHFSGISLASCTVQQLYVAKHALRLCSADIDREIAARGIRRSAPQPASPSWLKSDTYGT